MLDSLLAIGGLVLLRDSVEWEGRSLLKALIKKSALRGEQVHVLGCEVSEEEFREGFGSDVNSRLVYHDLFRDPLNWSKPGEAVPEGPLKALRSMCKRTDHGSVTIALDSLSWLLCHIPCVTLCQALHALSQQNGDPALPVYFLQFIAESAGTACSSSCPLPELTLQLGLQELCCRCPLGLGTSHLFSAFWSGDNSLVEQVRVLGLLHEELHGPGSMGALNTLAHTEVTLSGKMDQTSASILCRRPQQRATYQTWWFSVLPDFSLTLHEGLPLRSELHPDRHTTQVDPTAHLTFNLHLSKKEREARDSLTLPFQFSSEKQKALLHPVPGQTTGRIFYEPDAFDDVDQEDPDDDLDI